MSTVAQRKTQRGLIRASDAIRKEEKYAQIQERDRRETTRGLIRASDAIRKEGKYAQILERVRRKSPRGIIRASDDIRKEGKYAQILERGKRTFLFFFICLKYLYGLSLLLGFRGRSSTETT
ncbi:hypothetical protein CDAR_2061 [Caerostris darwini]|uniref:Uncharacterized protein n=1 Tax=Caerostris darwini TaxID=1538125 RepID=A0AAV4VI54_9ARAC|nr:hypothetical protein CDAR_2061 [Caerostris darwini]